MFGVYDSILLERNSSQSIRNLGQTKVLFRFETFVHLGVIWIRDIGRCLGFSHSSLSFTFEGWKYFQNIIQKKFI
jgi:hypothetical protein